MHKIRENLLGRAPEFLSVLRAMRIVAATDATVLINGESGTGKELLARALHRSSRRAAGPFCAVNCAALPESLVESELFGHRRGAFTGAVSDQPGRVQVAAGGTLFLDEVSELSLSAQAKLLRFLESGECQAVGRTHPEVVDVRVVAATNRDLGQAVREGRFRSDLYYRLYIVPLELPALRHRSGDIDLLLQGLTDALAVQYRLAPPVYSKSAMSLLRRYPWPGNVRELKNLCERMLILFSDRIIRAENLPVEIRDPAPADGGAKGSFLLPDDGLVLDELEASLIQQALGRASGNRSKAARLLGLSRDTLLYRIKKYAIEL